MVPDKKIFELQEVGLGISNQKAIISGKIISEEDQLKNLFKENPSLAFEKLYRIYYSRLCNHSLRMVHSKSIAQDIVTDVFTSFWHQKIHENIEQSYISYLYKAVRNRSINALKAELSHNNVSLNESHLLIKDLESPDQILQYQELSQKIDLLIKQLPNQARKAFLLSRLESKKYKEIADELNISQSAVERLVSRALNSLKLALKSEWIFVTLFLSVQIIMKNYN